MNHYGRPGRLIKHEITALPRNAHGPFLLPPVCVWVDNDDDGDDDDDAGNERLINHWGLAL